MGLLANTWKPLFVLLALLLPAFAAGCGGDGNDSAATTAATTTSAKAAAGDRFTTAQWQQYQADAAAFQKLNAATLVKVNACTSTINPPAGAMTKCVGDSLTNLGTATEKLGEDLDTFSQDVSGACLTALNGLINYIRPYQASIASLQKVIDADNFAAAYSTSSSMKTAQTDGRAANATVKTDCAPA